MTSLFQVIAHEDNNDQTKLRQAMALASERVEDRFGSFVHKGSIEDQGARWELVKDDVLAVVNAACDQVGFVGDPKTGRSVIYEVIGRNFITGPVAQRISSTIHEARKPKMCPYHSEVTDISLAAGDPQAGFNAMAQHAWSPQHCQGAEYKGDRCKFKPAMTTQSYWDEKAEKAEQRRNERAEREEQVQQEVLVNELPEIETPQEDFVDGLAETDTFDGPEEPSAVGTGVEEEIPMSMAASTVHTAPGGAHLPGASDKRNRQYEHIKEQCLADGGSEEHCKEVAARTVNKQRAEHGETKSHVAAEAVPTMDKRKWTPKTVDKDQPLNADDSDGRNPTKRKDIVEPIRSENNDGLYHSEPPKEIGESVTERQDVTQKGGIDRDTSQGGTFGGGERSAVSNLLDANSVKTALAKFKRA